MKIAEVNPDEQFGDKVPPVIEGRSYGLTVDFTSVIFNKEMTAGDFYYTGPKAAEEFTR